MAHPQPSVIRPEFPNIAAPTRLAIEAAGYQLEPAPVPGCSYVAEPHRTPSAAYTPVRFVGPPFVQWLRGRDPDGRYWVVLERRACAPVFVLVWGGYYASADRWLPLVASGNPFPHYRVASVYRVLDTPVKA